MLFSVLRSLLPPGSFWEMKSGSAFHKLLLALADELDRVLECTLNIFNLISYEKNPSRFVTLLGLKTQRLQSLDAQIQAIKSLLSREESWPPNLSRSFVEQRLHSLGYFDFVIHDPTEDDMGVEPIVDPDLVGVITVKTQITNFKELRAGFHAGDLLTQWRDDEFEKQVRSLIPAHITPKCLYRKKETFHV